LISILFSLDLFPENQEIGQFFSLVWVFPFLVFLYGDRFLLGPVFRLRRYFLFWLFFFVLAILFGTAFSSHPYIALSYLLATVLAFIIAAGFWEIGESNISRGLELYAILAGFSLFLFLGFYYTPGSRLGELRNPNTVGLISMGVAITSLIIRRRMICIIILAVSCFTIIASGSRAAFLSTSVAFLAYALFLIPKWTPIRIAILCSIAALILLILDHFYLSFYRWLFDSLYLYDPDRGLASGLSQRVIVWQETFDLWKQHPLLGIGYRTHEMYVFSKSSAHNGYLALLAEVGIIGVAPIILLITYSLWVLLENARKGHHLSRLGFALMIGMLIEAVFERYLINMGNPTSIMFLLFLLMPQRRKVINGLSQRSLRKAVL